MGESEKGRGLDGAKTLTVHAPALIVPEEVLRGDKKKTLVGGKDAGNTEGSEEGERAGGSCSLSGSFRSRT